MKNYTKSLLIVLLSGLTLASCSKNDKKDDDTKENPDVGSNKVVLNDTEVALKSAYITPYGEDFLGIYYEYSLGFATITDVTAFMTKPFKSAKMVSVSATIIGIDIYSKSSTFKTGTYSWVDEDGTEDQGISDGVILLGADFSQDGMPDFDSYYYFVSAKLVYSKSGNSDKYVLTGKVVNLTDFINENMENTLDVTVNFEGSTMEVEPEDDEVF